MDRKQANLLYKKTNKDLLDAEFKQCLTNVETEAKLGKYVTLCTVSGKGEYIQRCKELAEQMNSLGYKVEKHNLRNIFVKWS